MIFYILYFYKFYINRLIYNIEFHWFSKNSAYLTDILNLHLNTTKTPGFYSIQWKSNNQQTSNSQTSQKWPKTFPIKSRRFRLTIFLLHSTFRTQMYIPIICRYFQRYQMTADNSDRWSSAISLTKLEKNYKETSILQEWQCLDLLRKRSQLHFSRQLIRLSMLYHLTLNLI